MKKRTLKSIIEQYETEHRTHPQANINNPLDYVKVSMLAEILNNQAAIYEELQNLNKWREEQQKPKPGMTEADKERFNKNSGLSR